jgi:putative transposase
LTSKILVRILSVVDVYARECLALEADTSLGSGRVILVLERLMLERGAPKMYDPTTVPSSPRGD